MQKISLEACGLNSEEIDELEEFLSTRNPRRQLQNPNVYDTLLRKQGFELTPAQVGQFSQTQLYNLSRGVYHDDMNLTREQQIHADIARSEQRRKRKSDKYIENIRKEFPFYDENILQKLNPNELAKLNKGSHVNADRYAKILSPEEIEKMREHVSIASSQRKSAKY